MAATRTSSGAPVDFAPAMTSIPEARNLVLERVSGEAVDRDIVALLTSELVTNAIRHAGTRFRVDVNRRHGAIQVGVTDASTAKPHVVDAPAEALNGRGLQFVSRYASDWGVQRRRGGKRVWFELPVDKDPVTVKGCTGRGL
jgi:anti-sigma regulatory factor (Ser/Thr protein kinase)